MTRNFELDSHMWVMSTVCRVIYLGCRDEDTKTISIILKNTEYLSEVGTGSCSYYPKMTRVIKNYRLYGYAIGTNEKVRYKGSNIEIYVLI